MTYISDTKQCPDCGNLVPIGEVHVCTKWRPSVGVATARPEFRPTTANDVQVGGGHYKDRAIQPWDYIAANKLGFFEGNAIKYITRWREKGGVEDLRKAKHYIDKLIELEGNAR